MREQGDEGARRGQVFPFQLCPYQYLTFVYSQDPVQ